MTLFSGLEHILRTDEPLRFHTRPWLAATAEYYAEPTNEAELIELVRRSDKQGLPVRMVGSGSNILIRGDRISGLVIALSAAEFGGLSVCDELLVAGGGARLSHFVSTAVREGFSGPENLVGIPGTVGGAVHVNTSVGGYDICSGLKSARVMTHGGEIVTRDSESLSFSYRQSSLDELVVLQATFKFDREPLEILTRRMQKLWIVRRAAQPITHSSIYAFKDNGFESAGRVIEQCGLKGTRIGDVEVSDRDPSTLVAGDKANSADAIELIRLVKERVNSQIGVELETAVEIW
jgi:UDP-N-acetylmuramate dehydrogenase